MNTQSFSTLPCATIIIRKETLVRRAGLSKVAIGRRTSSVNKENSVKTSMPNCIKYCRMVCEVIHFLCYNMISFLCSPMKAKMFITLHKTKKTLLC